MRGREVTIADLTDFESKDKKLANQLIPKFIDLQIARIGSQADPVAEMAAKYNIREAIGILIRINPNYPVKEEWASYVPIVDR